MTARVAFFALAWCTSCGGTGATPTPPAAPAAASPAPTDPASSAPTDGGARWRCDADADCTLSCAYGAVSRAWARENIKQECTSGCARAGIAPRCDAGACTAYRNGARYDGCSGLAPEAPKKGQ